MKLEQVFQRFFRDWQQFGMIGLGAFLVILAAGAASWAVGLVLTGPSLFALAMGGGLEGSLLALFGAFFAYFVIMTVVYVIAGGLSNAGVVGSVLGYRKGEPVSLGTFWSHATRHYGKLILLGFLFALIMLVSGIINVVPLLGQLAYLIWLPVAAVALAIYPAHLIVSRNLGVGEALGIGFQLITGHFKETFVSGMILLLLGLVMGVVGFIPIIGWIAIGIFAQPLVVFLFVERFEAEVAPKLQGLPPVA